MRSILPLILIGVLAGLTGCAHYGPRALAGVTADDLVGITPQVARARYGEATTRTRRTEHGVVTEEYKWHYDYRPFAGHLHVWEFSIVVNEQGEVVASSHALDQTLP